MRRVASILTSSGAVLAVALLGPSAAASAAAAGDGSLTRVKGRAGCVAATGGSQPLRALRAGCVRARVLDGLGRVVVSPGGGSVYATAADSDAVAVFRRVDRTGTLRQLGGRAGCVSVAGRHGCGHARALRDPYAIVVSADGRNVYVGSGGGIAAFARDGRTGALRQLRGSAGCVSPRRGAGCGAARGVGFRTLALGPGGRFLYAGSSAGLAIFRRNARTGRLVQLRGADGCVTAKAVDGCARGRALGGVTDVALDRGGHNLYAAAGSVAVFKLAGGVPRQLPGAAGCISESPEGGGLPQLGCTPARTLNGPEALAISPAATQVYAAVIYRGAVAILTRDDATGALSQPPGPLGCIRDGGGLDCAEARHLEHPGGLELSHDGRNVYVVGPGVLVVLRRDRATGGLSQLPGKRGCLDSLSRAGAQFTDCTDTGRVNPLGVTLSRDGRNAYITDNETDVIAVYRRAR